MTVATASEREVQQVEETLRRIAGDLSMVVDRELLIESIDVTRENARPAGRAVVHISFKLGFQVAGEVRHGCLLVPLPDAIAVACYLMMVPDEGVKAKRALKDLDTTLKDALLEVGNFVGGATDSALRGLETKGIKVRSEGCQGVRADVRPALEYEEGAPLVVGRAKAKLHTYPSFDMWLVLPVLDAEAGASAAGAAAA